jgi:hypothetical protein
MISSPSWFSKLTEPLATLLKAATDRVVPWSSFPIRSSLFNSYIESYKLSLLHVSRRKAQRPCVLSPHSIYVRLSYSERQTSANSASRKIA